MISKNPIDSNKYSDNLIFTKNARTAWEVIIRSLRSELDIGLLLPCYIGRNDKEGSGVFDPVEKHKLRHQFYNLNDDLSVNIESFEKSIQFNDINVALIIHYFGFCRSDLQKIRDICNKRSVVLVEDCAHYFGLKSNYSIGTMGDYSFYSIHKFLPSGSGGILKINKPIVRLDKLTKKECISRAALEVYVKADILKINMKRIENYQLYEKALVSCEFYDTFYSLRKADIPQTFAIKVKKGMREKLYFYLLEKNMPVVALYYRMIDEISSLEHPISKVISSEILNLPVHQDTDSTDISKLTHEIKNFFNHA